MPQARLWVRLCCALSLASSSLLQMVPLEAGTVAILSSSLIHSPSFTPREKTKISSLGFN